MGKCGNSLMSHWDSEPLSLSKEKHTEKKEPAVQFVQVNEELKKGSSQVGENSSSSVIDSEHMWASDHHQNLKFLFRLLCRLYTEKGIFSTVSNT